MRGPSKLRPTRQSPTHRPQVTGSHEPHLATVCRSLGVGKAAVWPLHERRSGRGPRASTDQLSKTGWKLKLHDWCSSIGLATSCQASPM